MRTARIARLAGLLVAFLAAAAGSLAAQDLEFEDNNNAAVVAENAFDLHESNFDRWVFGNSGNTGTARDYLESLLLLSLGEVDRSCGLNEAQKKRLILAGRGDIKHFMDRLNEARKVFEQLRHDQNNINAIYQETLPLNATIRSGLFGPDSIFGKSIYSTLETDQAERYRVFVRERAEFRHQARIRMAIANLDQSIGLTAQQRKKLIELALRETKASTKSVPQYESQVVMLKLDRIPEAKLREILDESRCKALRLQFQQNRGMEQFLKQQGYLDDDDAPEPKPEPKDKAKAKDEPKSAKTASE